MDIVTKNKQTVQCEVLPYSGQTLEDKNGHSVIESTDGTV
jgi:hypothetical protein